jgi:hypothetical protein
MASKLLQDALADARAVKKTALANAKFALEETFQPTLQRMVSSKLAEEEGDEMDDEAEFDIDINVGDDADEDMALNDEPMEDDFATEEPEMDMGDDEEVAGDILGDMGEEPVEGEDDLELESLIRELEGEDEFSMEEGDEEDWSDPIQEEEMSDDEMLESFLDGIEDEEPEMDEELPPPAMESRRVRSENKQLKKKLSEAYSVVTKLKTVLNEVNLLNAKLMYNTKIQKQYTLSESQRERIINSLDRANTIREVKLVYTTVCESLNKSNTKPSTVHAKKSRMVEGFASKSTKVVKSNSNPDFNFVPRWQQLAGLKPFND